MILDWHCGFGNTAKTAFVHSAPFRIRLATMKSSAIRFVSLVALAALPALACSPLANADTYSPFYSAPALDRWNYPFNPTPGTRIVASTFGNEAGGTMFDNRDGQFIVGFNTAAEIPTHLGATRYDITRCVVEVTYANDFVVAYDNTVDPYTNFLVTTDRGYIEDSDAGQPIELYGTGFRNGFSLENWVETSPYTIAGMSALNPSVRNAFAMGTNAKGEWVDVSNNVRERWTPSPFAVGTIDGLKRGSLVPIGSTLKFELDVTRADVRAFLQSSLDAGKLRFTVCSLTKVVQQGGSFPQFYCRENPIVSATGIGDATLSLEVNTVSCVAADFDCDGTVGASDLAQLLALWGSNGNADLDGDGIVGAADLALLLASWS